MDFDMALETYLENNRENLKMGIACGKLDEAIKVIFKAGFQDGMQFAVNFQEKSHTEEL